MSILKALWGQLYDKVKVVVVTGLVALIGAVLDVFLGVDWTSIVGGSWSVVIGLAVASLVAFAKRELSGIFQKQIEDDVPVEPLPPATDEAPPVG